MELFALPHTAYVNKVIPKNAFDSYTTSRQKKLFTELIARITWLYKISTDTVNLEAKDIKEIQVIRIELKEIQDIQSLIDIIDKAIPYFIIFIIEFDQLVKLSTSIKHTHPLHEEKSVIDWTFKTAWFKPTDNPYTLILKKSIDFVYHDFCIQLSGKSLMTSRPLEDLIAHVKKVETLEKSIAKLQSAIFNCKQFNNKVQLNLKLNSAQQELKMILNQ